MTGNMSSTHDQIHFQTHTYDIIGFGISSGPCVHGSGERSRRKPATALYGACGACCTLGMNFYILVQG